MEDIESNKKGAFPSQASPMSNRDSIATEGGLDITQIPLARIDRVYRYLTCLPQRLGEAWAKPCRTGSLTSASSQVRTGHSHAILPPTDSSSGAAFWVLYFMCSAIRSNVGLAQTMNLSQHHDLGSVLHMTPKEISTGLALFYVCYVVFDFPSNLIMTRLSPRVWMSRIVIAVGIIGACMAAMRATWSF